MDWSAPQPGIAEELRRTRAQLHREQRARFVAEATAWRLRRGQALLAALAGAETPLAVARALLDHGLPLLGAAAGGLHLVREDGQVLELVLAAGYPLEVLAAWQWMPLAAPLPAGDAARGGAPMWIGSAAESTARYPLHMHCLAPIAARAVAALPLAVGGRPVGVLTLSFEEERSFGAEERAHAAELMAQVAPALARACRCTPLHAAGQQAIEALRRRDELLVAACHDLKVPISAIKMTGQLLSHRLARRASPATGSVLEELARIDAAVTRTGAIVDELVGLTRPQPALARTAVDLVALVGRVAREAQAAQPAQRIVVRADPPTLIGSWDAAHLERVFANLLDNALKYSPREAPVEVVLGAEAVGDRLWAVALIRDRGLGIPEADLPRVFDRFQRGTNVVDHLPGTGVGLASVREIVEQHGGAVEVASREGHGSTFTVRIPLGVEDATPGPRVTR